MKRLAAWFLITVTISLVVLAIMGHKPQVSWHQAPSPLPSMYTARQHGQAP